MARRKATTFVIQIPAIDASMLKILLRTAVRLQQPRPERHRCLAQITVVWIVRPESDQCRFTLGLPCFSLAYPGVDPCR